VQDMRTMCTKDENIHSLCVQEPGGIAGLQRSEAKYVGIRSIRVPGNVHIGESYVGSSIRCTST
jgi:hypothetical protein